MDENSLAETGIDNNFDSVETEMANLGWKLTVKIGAKPNEMPRGFR